MKGVNNRPIEPEANNNTILLAEDELMVRTLAVTILREEGYDVLESSDGEEALEVANQLEGKNINLLLSDISMPRMGGIELYQQFSSHYPGVPVLLMSGYTTGSIPRNPGSDKNVRFLPKPFTPTRLAEEVRAAPTQG